MIGVQDCPRCKGTSGVIDSRKQDEGIVRRRKCLNDKCKARWTTIEVPMRWTKEVKALRYIRRILATM